ncbi:hypothetical protein HDE69_000203 [Pedobacter cryoconitis]|uniref:Uncharacterized protein n=1 Tax=Pedobacter cryoconitis TaxID=188932 RepID=A0A7W8YP02_9SPHI|nr:hypothetical protein [Pedobacter cryoconitis]MBB5619167.1 hypothetical protein [Pedobacter cryoconitis]MBB5644462.1 hypothetical protein [Pedobacter cryoconitis]
MKSNIYLKVVLTVIAINLTLLTAKELNLFSTANAADIPAKPGKNGTNYGFIPVNEDGTINVRIKNRETMDVRVMDVYNPSLWSSIPVKVDR